MSRLNFIIILLCSFAYTSSVEIPNKICTSNPNTDACSQIKRDQQFECKTVKSQLDCIINADANLPILSIVSPEEALIAAPLVSNNTVVIAEIVTYHPPYETVVVVRSNGFSGGFENLRGLRYCHPGFKHDELVSRYVLEELESQVISHVNCTSHLTNVERKIEALAGFFGSSCRPGEWTKDLELDSKLKSTYPSLCKACDGQTCDVNYKRPFNDSLTCLKNSGGDIALTTLNNAIGFFNSSSSAGFMYLCPNGTVSNSSCVWTKQLPDILITSRNHATQMTEYIKTNLPSKISTASLQGLSPDAREKYLSLLLDVDRKKIALIYPRDLKSYVQASRKIPEAKIYCDLTVKWSTKNYTEHQKCLWARQAAINYALQPTIECVKINYEDDVTTQIKDVASGEADILYTDASYAYYAYKKDLGSIAYPETDNEQLTKVLIVLPANKTVSISGIKDLEGKRSCFPEYAGKEWLSFIDLIKEEKKGKSCRYESIFEDFVSESCVPDAIDTRYDMSDEIRKKLCYNCLPVSNTQTAQYCNADLENKFYGSDGALRCINEGSGDYAVISVNDVTTNYNESQFRVLCKNGSLAAYTGLDVDEKCYINIFIAGELVMKRDSPKINDAVLLFTEIEYYFGQDLHKPFKIFESFNETLDLLFPDSTPGLTIVNKTSTKYVENFVDLLKSSEECDTGGASLIFLPSIICLLTTFILRAMS